MEKNELETTGEEINIEEIMSQIRAEILAKRGGRPGDLLSRLPTSGRRFPPEFYDHLYQAGLLYDQVEAQLHLTPVPIPFAGPVVQWLRRKVHEVVLFYVNQIASQQIAINTHLLEALSILTQELEEDTAVG